MAHMLDLYFDPNILLYESVLLSVFTFSFIVSPHYKEVLEMSIQDPI